MASRPCSTRRVFAASALVLLALASCAVVSTSLAAEPARARRFVRPDPDSIRAEVDRILAEPRFAPHVSPLQRVRLWIGEKVAALVDLLGRAGTTLRVIIVVLCLLTLAAILGHIIYHLRLALRKPKHKASGLDFDDFDQLKDKPYDELLAIMRERAAKGRFRQAIGVMMLALLRWLDDAELVIFHQSKTNGDYVREYLPGDAGRADFGRFAVAFDAAVYGRATCDRAAFDDMNHLFEQVQHHAGEKPQE
jgi:hypothetical protein